MSAPSRSGPLASTQDLLLDAAVAHLREQGADGLTVRSVAERAGVTHTTGYAYFSSLDHLVAAVFLRRVRSVPDEPCADGASVAERVGTALRPPSRAASEDPALARAGQRALFADEPAVAELRDELGEHIVARLRSALGREASAPTLELLLLAYSGAMLQASLGYLPFDDVPDRLGALATRLVSR